MLWSNVQDGKAEASRENLTRSLAARLGAKTADLLVSAAHTVHFGAWFETVAGPPATGPSETVHVEAAIAGLRSRLAALRRVVTLEIVSETQETAAA